MIRGLIFVHRSPFTVFATDCGAHLISDEKSRTAGIQELFEVGDEDPSDNLTVQIYISNTSSDPFNNPMLGYPQQVWSGQGGASSSWTPSSTR